MDLAILLAYLPIIALIAVFVVIAVVWRYADKPAADVFLKARVDFFCRLWRFAGPRFTDRNFLSAIAMNVAGLGLFSVSPEKLNFVVLGVWLVANLINPTWDAHPAGERLAPLRIGTVGGKLVLEDPEQREAFKKIVRETISSEYAGAH